MESKIILGKLVPNVPLHKVINNPRHAAFLPETAAESTSLKELALLLLREERAKSSKKDVDYTKESPVVDKIQSENPSKVEDKTESTKLKTPKQKKVPGALKVTKKTAKYTQLSNYIPVEYTRSDSDEVPSINDAAFEKCCEEEECDDSVDSNHVVTEATKSSKGKSIWRAKNNKWGARNSSGITAYFKNRDSAIKHRDKTNKKTKKNEKAKK